jgi:hypothetical protein
MNLFMVLLRKFWDPREKWIPEQSFESFEARNTVLMLLLHRGEPLEKIRGLEVTSNNFFTRSNFFRENGHLMFNVFPTTSHITQLKG